MILNENQEEMVYRCNELNFTVTMSKIIQTHNEKTRETEGIDRGIGRGKSNIILHFTHFS